jgi:hypothetical protein
MAASNAPKRTLRDIWPHLVVSACALLLPPLGMAAGVVYLGSPHEIAASGPAEPAAVAVAEPTKAPDPGPVVAAAPVAGPAVANPSVASAVPSPAEQRPAPEAQVAAAPAPAPAAAAAPASIKDVGTKDTASTKDRASAKDTAGTKDVATKDAAAPAVAKIGETFEGSARAEATPPTENADTAAPAANAQQSGQKSRHESRGGRVRQAHVPSLTDIFGVRRYR